MKVNGAIIYEGPSQIDGQPIVAIATGLVRDSDNQKTGAMVQTFIMRADLNPFGAAYSGEDVSVCGPCPKRYVPASDGKRGSRDCYVNVAKAPNRVWDAYKRGIYGAINPETLRGKKLRVGSYGDPAAVPFGVWAALLPFTTGHSGYTHQWRDDRFAPFRQIVMASCDLAMDVRAATKLGWRSFYVVPTAGDATGTVEGAMRCPASAERNQTTCAKCLGCNGTGGRNKRNIVINQHK